MPCNAQFLDEQSRRYVRELTVVLAELDLGRLKEFYRKWAGMMDLPPMPDDQKLEEEMHLMVLELPGLEHLHKSSRQWLQDRGLAAEVRGMNCRKNGGSGGAHNQSPDDGCCDKSQTGGGA